MLVPLRQATVEQCGGKAASLGELLRAGFPVPDGFVVMGDGAPNSGVSQLFASTDRMRSAVAHELGRMGEPLVAVRSSAGSEDTANAAAAGQYETVLGVRGSSDICQAIALCLESANSTRAADYWRKLSSNLESHKSRMAVLVQRLVNAEVSGVMFTPERAGDPTLIEASWGLGTTVVGGNVSPDSYQVSGDGAVRCTVGAKESQTIIDPATDHATRQFLDKKLREARTLSDEQAKGLAELGARIAGFFGAAQDVEWAIADGQVWIVQSRPITASVPYARSVDDATSAPFLTGSPGSHGLVTAPARIVRSQSDFARLRPGEILVCPYTDPSWTPLFTIASGVITETGGVLSHAAIVAREYGIPAAIGVEGAMRQVRDGTTITLDGSHGTVTAA